MAEFTYEVTERIRDWSPDGSRMAKGISLTEEELKTLKGILDDMEL